MHKVFDKLHNDNANIDPKFKSTLLGTLKDMETTMATPKKHLSVKELFHQRQFMRASGVAVIAIVAVSGLAVNAQQQSNQRQSTIESNLEVPAQLDGVLAIEQMRTLAEKDKPAGASITKIELENEHGTVLYKVKFSDGSYRLYDAKTGLAFVDSTSVEKDESIPAGFVAGITVQQARDIAAGQRPGKTITKVQLETEEGKVVYSVRFSDNGRVDISATDGSVISVRQGESQSSSGGGSSNDDSTDDSSGSSDSQESGQEDEKKSEDNSGSGSSSDTEDDSSGSNSNHGSDN